MLTVKPISIRGPMNSKKLKRYAKDSNVFVMYNAYHFIAPLFAKINNPNCPSYEECYRVRPLSYFYNRATSSNNSIVSTITLDSLCRTIDHGSYILFRIGYVNNHASCVSQMAHTGKKAESLIEDDLETP